jgi:hypothetical protein
VFGRMRPARIALAHAVQENAALSAERRAQTPDLQVFPANQPSLVLLSAEEGRVHSLSDLLRPAL